jgi:hypothetical protein
MEGLLVVAICDLAVPYGRSSDLATLADEQIPRDKLKTLGFIGSNFQGPDIPKIEPAPLNVLVSQVRLWIACWARLLGKHFAKLGLRYITEFFYGPTRGAGL